jgi:arsenate reductase
MKKFFYLASCSTCSRIMKEIGIENSDIELREIKSAPITEKEMEDLFSF